MLEPLEAYFRLLAHWNAKINLTALPLDPPTDETFDRLLVEPLGAVEADSDACSERLVRPRFRRRIAGDSAEDRHVRRSSLTMIESKERKSAFLREAIRTLGLTDTMVETGAVRGLIANDPDYRGSADFVTVRAVTADDELFADRGRVAERWRSLAPVSSAHSASPDSSRLRCVIDDTVPLLQATARAS